MEKARGCFRHLKTIFQELEECRAFELLKVTSSVSLTMFSCFNIPAHHGRQSSGQSCRSILQENAVYTQHTVLHSQSG